MIEQNWQLARLSLLPRTILGEMVTLDHNVVAHHHDVLLDRFPVLRKYRHFCPVHDVNINSAYWSMQFTHFNSLILFSWKYKYILRLTDAKNPLYTLT